MDYRRARRLVRQWLGGDTSDGFADADFSELVGRVWDAEPAMLERVQANALRRRAMAHYRCVECFADLGGGNGSPLYELLCADCGEAESECDQSDS